MPDIKQRTPCKLVGEDGNVFTLIGRARLALRKANRHADAEEMAKRVMAAKAYHHALAVIQEYVYDPTMENSNG